MLEILPLDKLVPATDNPRRDVGDVTELAATITSAGLLQPLVVCPAGDGTYTVVAGHRRLAAAKVAGLAEVPCIVREMTDRDRIEAMAIENLQRTDLTPFEEARAFKALEGLGVKQRDLATRVGRSQSHVSKRLALLRLPDAAVAAADSGSITIEQALALTKVPQKDLTKLFAKKGGPSQYDIEREIHHAEQEEKRTTRIAALKAKGILALRSAPTGAKRIGQYYLDVNAQKHAKEPCHRVVVETWSQHSVCTEPARHNAKGASPLKATKRSSQSGLTAAQKEAEAKRKLETQLREEATAARRAVLKSVLAKQPKGPLLLVALSLVVEQMAHGWRTGPIAADLLGVKPVGQDAESPIIAFAAKSEANAMKAVAVLGLVALEELLDDSYDRGAWAEAETVEYFKLLGAKGHKPTEWEQAKLVAGGGR